MSVTTATFYLPDGDPEWRVTLIFQEVDGRAECVSFEVSSVPNDWDGITPKPVTASFMRSLSVGAMIREARVQLHDIIERSQHAAGPVDDLVREIFDRQTSVYGPKRRLGADHFIEVASVYSDTYLAGGNPTAAVAEHFSVSKSAAAKWVARCREMKLLNPTRQGQPGGIRKDEQ